MASKTDRQINVSIKDQHNMVSCIVKSDDRRTFDVFIPKKSLNEVPEVIETTDENFTYISFNCSEFMTENEFKLMNKDRVTAFINESVIGHTKVQKLLKIARLNQMG